MKGHTKLPSSTVQHFYEVGSKNVSSPYLWKVSFGIHHEERCFPTPAISNDDNFEIFTFFRSAVACQGTVLSHISSGDSRSVDVS